MPIQATEPLYPAGILPSLAAIKDKQVMDKLEYLATDEDEAKARALDDRSYRQFRANYDAYVKRYRPCGN